MKKPILLLLPLFFLMLQGCRSGSGYQASDISYIYNNKDLAPRPHFVVHHQNEELSRIHYRLNTSDLLYMRDPEKNDYFSQLDIHYTLMPSFENNVVLDSGVLHLQDRAPTPPKKALIGSFDLNTPQSEGIDKYILRLRIFDRNRSVNFDNFIHLDKSSNLNQQYFLLTDTAGNVIFKNHVPRDVPVQLQHAQLRMNELFVSLYARDFPIALPPYSSGKDHSFDLTPDTTYTADLSEPFVLTESGFYHFRTDTSQWKGFTLYSFYDQFPYVATSKQMGPPLRYLTTKREFEQLSIAFADKSKLKPIVDEFWLERSGSVDRSKMLVEAYYTRVQEANIFFSSYLEGWKTDRGIIYTVYGAPDKVYRSSTGESWIYGDENSALSYVFNFVKVSNPFTNNDYSLERSGSYRYGWGQAIESWRNGHIYNSRDIKQEQNEQEQNRYRQRPPYWY